MPTMTDTIYSNPLNGRDIEHQTDDEQITVIRVRTLEPVTPAYLAMRMAEACGGAALREGESISADGLEFTVGPPSEVDWEAIFGGNAQ